MALLSAMQLGVDVCNKNRYKCAGVRMALYSFPAFSVCIVASKIVGYCLCGYCLCVASAWHRMIRSLDAHSVVHAVITVQGTCGLSLPSPA